MEATLQKGTPMEVEGGDESGGATRNTKEEGSCKCRYMSGNLRCRVGNCNRKCVVKTVNH